MSKINFNNHRFNLIDEIRGFLICCMVFYHAFYLMAYFFSMDIGLELLNFFMPIEPIFAGMFIMISGLCCNFSHSNLKRGIKLLIIALCITIITYLFSKDSLIVFGILHMLSICMILAGLIEPIIKKISYPLGMSINVILYILTLSIKSHKIGILGTLYFTIPNSIYKTNLLAPFGIYNSKFFSADYFPLFPWMFIFMFGIFLGKYLIQNNLIYLFSKGYCKFFRLAGRYSLLIYILHQPVIFIILWISGLFIS